MRPPIFIALALVFASGSGLHAMSECQAGCEAQYKACSSGRKMTDSNCRAQYEKCRKACLKKAESPAPA